MTSASEATTEALDRRHVAVRVGSHRFTLPIATIAVAILGALGTAYRVVSADRADVLHRIETLERADAELCKRLEIEQLTLAEIRTQLARIDARVAEVQVTLMRRPQ